jgi:hypothetical protein
LNPFEEEDSRKTEKQSQTEFVCSTTVVKDVVYDFAKVLPVDKCEDSEGGQ